MLDQLTWWGAISLEALLLQRGLRSRLIARYPVFYFYILFVVLQSVFRFITYHWQPLLYSYVYWLTEFVGVLLGCGVVLEIHRVGLSAYPGAARMARKSLLVVFLLVTVLAIVHAANDPRWWAEATVTEIERGLRIVQSLSLIVLVSFFLHYSIPFGKNLRGILFGYGLFIAASVIWLTFVYTGGSKFRSFWFFLYPMLYTLCLLIWIGHLWGYYPDPRTKACVQFEQEYAAIAAITKLRLQGALAYLDKVIHR